ncbi:MAG: FAD-dependent oxidoreductase [Actinomycetota bacterium]|nr:FAD-dependent oxidoreductase [Actinomycetota bacterium]
MSGRYDLVVVGGGTAALVASLGVAGLGGRAAVVADGPLGGDCLWTGCVPSKTLLAAAGVVHAMRTADRHGLMPVDPEVDLARVMAQVRAAQAVIEPHDSPERLRAEGVEVIEARGRFAGPGVAVAGDRELRFRAALIATGSRPVVPPIPGLAAADPLTSETVWELDELPARLVVIGGGPVGCELGQAFARLGSRVTIVEVAPTLLAGAGPGVGELLAERLRGEGVDVATATHVTSVRGHEPVTVELTGSDVATSAVTADRILVATGRRPNTADLGLDLVGVETGDDGRVLVDDRLRTSGDRIFAAGDVTALMPFTHVAAHHARLVVTNAMFRTRRTVDHDAIPWAVFTDPEVARVGLDATAARQRWGDDAIVQRFDHAGLDRAITAGDPAGWSELVADPKRRLVGATVVGAAAGESIAELAAWMTAGAKVDRISTTVHAYPTFAEGPSRAADDVLRGVYLSPTVRRLTTPLLAALRHLDRPR